MSERRERSATESLLTVAYGVEMAAVVFGTIAIAGMHKDHVVEVLVTAFLLLMFLYVAMATLRRGVNPIVYVSQVVLLLPVITEPLWAGAWVVCMIFWTYCLVKGRSLDRRKGNA